jgi:hypothetical protein
MMTVFSRFSAILCLLAAVASCTGSKGTQSANPNTIILGTWIRSSEEDTKEGGQAYRRPEHAFPPSRGRSSFTFHPNGDCVVKSIAPTDGILEQKGKWLVHSNKLEIAPNEKTTWKFAIHLIVPELLILFPQTP